MSNPTFWQEFYDLGKAAGAKFPELVAAQAALESGWGSHLSGKNNYFGIKGSPGTVVTTQEWTGTRYVTIKDEFKDFDSPLECVRHLVDQWYKDYRDYKGVNRAASRDEAAELLRAEGYATDPAYPELLIFLMDANEEESQEEDGYYLHRAAKHYREEPHQIEAWLMLEENLEPEVLEAFKAAYKGKQEPVEVTESSTIDEVLDVPYFSQLDSDTGMSERMCFSSSMAMALEYIDPERLDGDDDDYLRVVLKFGDTVSSEAQVKAARSLGYSANFRMDGRREDLERLLDDGIPVPIGILHKGPVDRPSGGGHYIVLVGHNDTEFICHDPFGDLDLIGGGYISTGPTDGKFIRYSKKNLMKRWLISSDHDGWFVDLS